MKCKKQYREPKSWFRVSWRPGVRDLVEIKEDPGYYHKYGYHWRNFRHAWFQEQKARIDSLEQDVFVRQNKGRYGRKIDPWDEVPNSRYKVRSWKDSHKIKKQWMKNL